MGTKDNSAGLVRTIVALGILLGRYRAVSGSQK